MKCVICKSENIVKKDVEEEIRIDKDIYFVTIKTLVCTECGERYYDRNTIRKLEKLEEELRDNKCSIKQVGKVMEVGNY